MMENGSFQTPFSDMAGLDFREPLPATPDQAPPPGRERARGPASSATVESLIAQNEDMMARLKVALRRLAVAEGEIDQLREQEKQFKIQNSSLSDQLLVWREKENFWQKKNQTLEQQNQSIQARYPEFESMRTRLDRYEKYHEKVKTQVKPYLQQLKSFAQNLALEIRNLNNQIEEKEIRRQDVERRLRDLRQEVDLELTRQEEKTQQLTAVFEREKARMQQELDELRTVQGQLEIKAEKFDGAMMRQDELENMVIALRRAREEAEVDYRNAQKSRDLEIQHLKSNAIQDGCKIEDLENKLKVSTEEADRARHRAEGLEEQLTSLRYLWTSKSEDLSQAELRIEALEKLNQELSQRLNQARKGEASL